MNAVRDGESVLMGVGDENECHLWVMALYRATGQSHKPTPPTTSDTHHKIMGGRVLNALRTAERDEALNKRFLVINLKLQLLYIIRRLYDVCAHSIRKHGLKEKQN